MVQLTYSFIFQLGISRTSDQGYGSGGREWIKGQGINQGKRVLPGPVCVGAPWSSIQSQSIADNCQWQGPRVQGKSTNSRLLLNWIIIGGVWREKSTLQRLVFLGINFGIGGEKSSIGNAKWTERFKFFEKGDREWGWEKFQLFLPRWRLQDCPPVCSDLSSSASG